MATLAANAARAVSYGSNRNHIPVIATDIIYEGAAVGVVAGTGYARPLVGGDRFAGVAVSKCDNSTDSAGDRAVDVYSHGMLCGISVSGAVITDIGQPVFATDDDTFVFSPVGATFVGYVRRFVSSGVVDVEFNVEWENPYGLGPKELVSSNKTLDVEDNGKTFFVDTDAVVITIPATATALECTIVNIAAFGASGVALSPQAADKIMGPDLAPADNTDVTNTKATARRGDRARIRNGHADGPTIVELVGTWA